MGLAAQPNLPSVVFTHHHLVSLKSTTTTTTTATGDDDDGCKCSLYIITPPSHLDGILLLLTHKPISLLSSDALISYQESPSLLKEYKKENKIKIISLNTHMNSSLCAYSMHTAAYCMYRVHMIVFCQPNCGLSVVAYSIKTVDHPNTRNRTRNTRNTRNTTRNTRNTTRNTRNIKGKIRNLNDFYLNGKSCPCTFDCPTIEMHGQILSPLLNSLNVYPPTYRPCVSS
ncbi:hypothetical protein BDF14DRAFT_967237 [Spinellus fusiger]|nr:hypothetical protein BDF14DRAFT_967237 [Spinellus fusiger]